MWQPVHEYYRHRSQTNKYASDMQLCLSTLITEPLSDARQSRKELNGSAAYINIKTYKIGDLASM